MNSGAKLDALPDLSKLYSDRWCQHCRQVRRHIYCLSLNGKNMCYACCTCGAERDLETSKKKKAS